MQRRDYIVINKILSEIDIAFDMIGDSALSDFLNNEMMQRAVSMTVINIGELVKTITDETRLEYQNIPWKAIAGMRDIAAHKYQTLRMEDVYNTVMIDLPYLRMQLRDIIDNHNGFISDNNSIKYAERIEEILKDKETLKEVGENAFKELYISWDDEVKYIYDEYLRLIESRKI